MLKSRSNKDETFNLGSPLEQKGFTPKAIFLNLPQIFQEYNLRIARSTGVANTRACSRASEAENPMLPVEGNPANRVSFDLSR